MRGSDMFQKGESLPGVCPGSSHVRNTPVVFSGAFPVIVRLLLKK